MFLKETDYRLWTIIQEGPLKITRLIDGIQVPIPEKKNGTIKISGNMSSTIKPFSTCSTL